MKRYDAIIIGGETLVDIAGRVTSAARRAPGLAHRAAGETGLVIPPSLSLDVAAKVKELEGLFDICVPSRRDAYDGGPTYAERYARLLDMMASDPSQTLTVTGDIGIAERAHEQNGDIFMMPKRILTPEERETCRRIGAVAGGGYYELENYLTTGYIRASDAKVGQQAV